MFVEKEIIGVLRYKTIKWIHKCNNHSLMLKFSKALSFTNMNISLTRVSLALSGFLI
jgi:hypothetical protein